MHISYALPLLAAMAPLAIAQAMIPTSGSSTFPACAVGCTVLLAAQTLCTPPNHITSTQDVYDDCFCQAPTLNDLYTTGETVCTSNCVSTSDRQLLSTWYASFCKAVEAGTTSGSSTATATTTSTSTSTSTQSSKPESTYVVVPSTDTRPWIQTHWQWLIMLLFLFFGFLAIGFGARWWKKRYDLKNAQKRASMSDLPAAEGKGLDRESALSPEPLGSYQQVTNSQRYSHTSNSVLPIISEDQEKEKSKRASRVAITELQPIRPVSQFDLEKNS